MKNDGNKKTVYTKAQIIKMVARRIRLRKSLVEDVFDGLEKEIFELLASADESGVSLRLFEGITLDSEFVPESEKVNNLTGNKITTLAKIKAKANITRHYCGKLFKHNQEQAG